MLCTVSQIHDNFIRDLFILGAIHENFVMQNFPLYSINKNDILTNDTRHEIPYTISHNFFWIYLFTYGSIQNYTPF